MAEITASENLEKQPISEKKGENNRQESVGFAQNSEIEKKDNFIENPLAQIDLEQLALQQEQISQSAVIDNTTKKDDAKDEDKKQAGRHLKMKNLAKELATIQDVEERIEKLVNLATEHDPIMAINVAKDLDDNYVLDRLNDQLHEEHVQKSLKEKGFIK